ncbi:MAG: hypothetical protein ACKOFJ_07715 [Actinomycetota bacterium]
MIETLFVAVLVTWFLMRRRRRKSIDVEYRELVDSEVRVKESATRIRDFLINIIQDEKNDVEPFGDLRLDDARKIINDVGPGAFYWMTHIAAQLASVSAAQINQIPTNVDAELRDRATPEDVVRVVVKV